MVNSMIHKMYNDLSIEYFNILKKSYNWMQHPIARTKASDHGYRLSDHIIELNAGRETGKSIALETFLSVVIPKTTMIRYYGHSGAAADNMKRVLGPKRGMFYASRTFLNDTHKDAFRGISTQKPVIFVFEECNLSKNQIVDRIHELTLGRFESNHERYEVLPVIVKIGK